MGMPAFSEWLIIFAVVLLLFGGKKLPALGGAIGESIRNFKRGVSDETDKVSPASQEALNESEKTEERNPP